MSALDDTHDPARASWVESAHRHHSFPLQNLPLGVFSPAAGAPRGGIAIGDEILDLRALHESGLLRGEAAEACAACAEPALNLFLAQGAAARRALRTAVSLLLDETSAPRPELLHAAAECVMHMPAQIGDYTDFYAGIHHAINVGQLFRPDNPLLPNYKFVPIGYHGRASSMRVSGVPVRRPTGQTKDPERSAPDYGPSKRLDYELELGIWVGPGNALGASIATADAHRHIAGYSLLNDWSARDLQAWEYQPLGPFLSKSFHSTLSPWIVTPEALAPFRAPQPSRPDGDPLPLPYLTDEADQRHGALDLDLEILLLTPAMRRESMPPHIVSRTSTLNLYWTPAQLLAHHSSNGCNLTPGDLLGSGTISSPEPGGHGSMLEATNGGREPITLPSGETRRFLEDGDDIILRAQARRPGFASIGFGDCRAVIQPA